MNIVLLGSGNVATQLGRAFKLAGQDIVQVWSRNIENARELADNLAATAISDFDHLDRKADLYIISVKDEAINDLAKELKVSDKLIVHTSGSTGIDVLIGTPNKLGEMFTTAGYNVNRLKMFILDDADPILKLRHETKIMRISNSINKTQRIIFADVFSERIEILAEKMLVEPFEFDFEDEEEEESDEEEEIEE